MRCPNIGGGGCTPHYFVKSLKMREMFLQEWERVKKNESAGLKIKELAGKIFEKQG